MLPVEQEAFDAEMLHKFRNKASHYEPDRAIRVWTDGSALDNQNKALRTAGAGVFYGNGHQNNRGTPVCGEQTNQRAELTAVIACIQHDSRRLHICTDSSYVVNGLTQWLPEWKALGWRHKVGKRRTAPVKNVDLWRRLDKLWGEAPEGHLSIQWVKGHANHKHVAAGVTTELDAWGNYQADRLAVEAAQRIQGFRTGQQPESTVG